jgi:hypothetical protein
MPWLRRRVAADDGLGHLVLPERVQQHHVRVDAEPAAVGPGHRRRDDFAVGAGDVPREQRLAHQRPGRGQDLGCGRERLEGRRRPDEVVA